MAPLTRADVLSPVDDRIMAPLDYALYFRQVRPSPPPFTPTPHPHPAPPPPPCQIPCADYLRSLGGKGYLSKKETAEVSVGSGLG